MTLAGLRKGNISFTLQVANDTTGVPIPVDASASVVQAEVSRLLRSSSSTRDGVSAALPPLGNAHLEHPPVTVTRSGSCAAGYVWTVTYTAFYGPAPDLHVADSAQLENATADRRTPTLTVDQTTSKSMLRLRPILEPSQEVFTDPQVVVHINGHSATCNATNPRDATQDPLDPRDADCSFDFSSTATPRVRSVFPESGAGGTVITVTLEDAENSSFAFSNESVRVFIGEHAECLVTSVAGNIVMCVVPESGVSPGPVRVRVLVEPWGFAAMHNGSANAYTFTLVSTITSVHPTQGSIAGGTRLSVHGAGLGSPIDGHDSVEVLLTAVHGNTVVRCPVVCLCLSD